MVQATNVQAVAKDAWIYAYPMLMNYQTLYGQAVDSTSSQYVGGFNVFRNYAQFFTPDNRDIVTPNNDTPYSWAWLDLRAEPIVLSIPAIPGDRYNVFQMVDLFTYNFAYAGTRSTGREAGSYLIAGPDWNGTTPPGITAVFKADTRIVMILGRTSLAGPDDIPALKALQAQYKLQPLSAFAGTPPPPAAPPVTWIPWDKARGLGPDFPAYLNMLLQFCRKPPFPDEAPLMERFATLSNANTSALQVGIADGQHALKQAIATTRSSMNLFGTHAKIGNDYVTRAVAAAMGIYGNTSDEAVYLGGEEDGSGRKLDGSQRYTLTFAPGQTPPVTAFWSVTMYDLPNRLLVANPINRYSLGDRSKLTYAPDGSLTIYIQAQSPGADKESNWLPSPPSGPFNYVVRLYGPKPEVLNGTWKIPGLVNALSSRA
ncbi:MAG TPA: DUF1254 domain-containing protein [Candidatus Acidoferrum sp.]|jgi:hypothetical protein|nr:DUF1254 domain-containing protein [Candidatus Acidoferrum sp.]